MKLNLKSSKLAQNWQALPKLWRIVFIIMLMAGIFFRFAKLEGKIVWHDEALTMSRVSGYYAQEINKNIFNGQLIEIKDVRKYQQTKPGSNLFDIVNILATDNPQHPPIYYLLLRLWRQIFGQSIGSARSLSALFSVLVFPSVYLLWKELKQPSTGLIGIIIIAVSPIHVLYAQEAREYSLWTLSTLISSIALLRAIRFKNFVKWTIYAFSSLIGLYVFPFSLIVSIGHGIYLAILGEFKYTKNLNYFLSAFGFAFIGFFPWLLLTIKQWSESGSQWTANSATLISLIQRWSEHIDKAFFVKLNEMNSNSFFEFIALSLLLFITIYSFYLLIKKTDKNVWLFIIILSGSVFLFLAGVDLLLGGQRSTPSRYIIPSIFGIQMSIAFGLGYCIKSSIFIKKKLAQLILITIVFICSISCIVNLQKDVTWSKGASYYLLDVSKIINNSQVPVVVSNSEGLNFGNILALSHIINDKVLLLLVDGWNKPDYQNIPEIPPGFDTIFFINVSKNFENRIEQKNNFQLENVYYDDQLRLKKAIIKN